MRLLTTHRSHIIASGLILLAVVGFVAYMLRSDENTPADYVRQTLDAPDMTTTIELVFDAENPNAYYDWAIVETERGETFIETNSFSQFGTDYELLLATRKESPEAATYTIPDYITLTMRIPNSEDLVDVITYIDIAADGSIDTVYLNDVEVTSGDALFFAQDQYATELYASRDYMLDGVSI